VLARTKDYLSLARRRAGSTPTTGRRGESITVVIVAKEGENDANSKMSPIVAGALYHLTLTGR